MESTRTGQHTSTSIGSEISEKNGTLLKWIQQTQIQKRDMLLLGLMTVIGGQYSGWNVAYDNTFTTSILSLAIPTLGYLMLTFCLAEMSSALPFCGGVYGLARAFVHPLFGRIVAMFELTMDIFYVSRGFYDLGYLPVAAGMMDRVYLLPLCLLFYITFVLIAVVGGKLHWGIVLLFGSSLILFATIYQLGSLRVANWDNWVPKESVYSHSHTTITDVIAFIPAMSGIYLGIQYIPLTSRGAAAPKKDVPMVMLVVIAVSVLNALGFLILACSQYPGIDNLVDEEFPLRFGFSTIFGVSEDIGPLFSYPFIVGTCYSFLYFSGRQLSMMAKSGLVPAVFKVDTPYLDTPWTCLVFVALFAFSLNVISYNVDHTLSDFEDISGLASFLVFIGAMWSYVVFHKTYSSLERGFRSPLQEYGAYFGILIFSFCFIGTIAFQDGGFTPIVVIVIIGILAILYHFCLAGAQVFSEEEKEELFKAYLVNANLATKRKMKRRKNTNGARSHQSNSKIRNNNSRANSNAPSLASIEDKAENQEDDEEEGGGGTSEGGEVLEEEVGDIAGGNDVHGVKSLLFASVIGKGLAKITKSSSGEAGVTSTKSPSTVEGEMNNAHNQAASIATSQKTISAKILQYFSSKFNSVVPEQPQPQPQAEHENNHIISNSMRFDDNNEVRPSEEV